MNKILSKMANNMRFIDIGANLTDDMYKGLYNRSKKHEADLSSVLERCWNNGMDKMIITAGNLDDIEAALKITELDERLYTTVGCHPTRCNEFEKNPEEYVSKLKDFVKKGGKKIVALGECGLDYDRLKFCSVKTQKNSLKTVANLEVAAKIPIDRLLIETDCPWCEIRPTHAGAKYIKTKYPTVKKEKFSDDSMIKGRNEPANIIQVIEVLAAIRGEDAESLSQTMLDNTNNLFFKSQL